ncbi:MAG: hypothetical protein ACOYN0_11695 [Phycisphaerales bacterium]
MLKPASLYFGLTFAAGFVLGAIRTLLVVAWVGELGAVLIECPLILLASFLVGRWVLGRFARNAGARRRLWIGVLAFVMLQCAELTMTLLLGGTARGFFAAFLKPAGIVGLAAQLLFAFIPLMIRLRPTTD